MCSRNDPEDFEWEDFEWEIMDESLVRQFDGTPEEFPAREKAMQEYRTIWLGRLGDWGCSPQSQWRRRLLEVHMEDLCKDICPGPGPLWMAFARTLPGFVEYVERCGESTR